LAITRTNQSRIKANLTEGLPIRTFLLNKSNGREKLQLYKTEQSGQCEKIRRLLPITDSGSDFSIYRHTSAEENE